MMYHDDTTLRLSIDFLEAAFSQSKLSVFGKIFADQATARSPDIHIFGRTKDTSHHISWINIASAYCLTKNTLRCRNHCFEKVDLDLAGLSIHTVACNMVFLEIMEITTILCL